jgi:hypothetical protein
MQIGGEWRCVDSSSTIDGWNQNHSPYEWVGSDPTILGLAYSFSQRWQGDFNNNRLHNICESANYFSERKNHI